MGLVRYISTCKHTQLMPVETYLLAPGVKLALRVHIRAHMRDLLFYVLPLPVKSSTNIDNQRIHSTFHYSTMSRVHDDGAIALIKHRGKEINTRSHVAVTLLYAVYNQMVDHSWRPC